MGSIFKLTTKCFFGFHKMKFVEEDILQCSCCGRKSYLDPVDWL